MGIGYFLFTDCEQRNLQALTLATKRDAIKISTFDTIETGFDFPVKDIVSIFELFIGTSKHYRAEKKPNDKAIEQISDILLEAKTKFEKILCFNYKAIHECFVDLERDKISSAEEKYENMQWSILLAICYFLCFKATIDNFRKILFLFNVFTPKPSNVFSNI